MQRLGRMVADFVAQHLATLREQPAYHTLDRPSARQLFADTPPVHPTAFEEILEHFRERVVPHHAREPHPRFLGYIPSCPTFPAVVGDWLATGFNFFAGVWSVAAGPNAVELTVLEWFRQWMGMPQGSRGLLTSGGSAATVTALVAARHAALGDDTTDIGRLAVYASDQAHSSVAKAAWIAGIPRRNVRAVPTDTSYRMRTDKLRELVDQDRKAGLRPLVVAATAGATNTGAVDPLHDIADFAAAEKLWLHTDSAYAGFSVLTERGRRLLDGLGRADSLTLDPHKWLYVPFECGCLMVKDPLALERAFSVHPEYLQDVRVRESEVNFADSGEQLTRYARALKVWVSVQYFGTRAIGAAQDAAMELAELAEKIVRESPDLEVLTPAQFGIVCFRVHPPGMSDEEALNALNERVNERVNRSGFVLMSSTRLRGALSLRLCIPGYRTRAEDVEAVLDLIRRTAADEISRRGRA
ncbi:MAG TPA: aminotransferase class V-fold PLP-dependent enzyme [Gemmatimonadaceae bacterium]|nr:aminotransferase class V-fold PLP-dependent enzyme [Gemmatimonadaceae bacterium]